MHALAEYTRKHSRDLPNFKPPPRALDEIVAATSALVVEALSVTAMHPVGESTPLAFALCKGPAWYVVAPAGSTLDPVCHETEGDRAYLPLIVPGDSFFCVGGEVQRVHPGELIVFDKRQMHCAYNEASATFLVLDLT